MRDEITIQNNVLLKRDRIIVPKSMQSEMLNLIHEGHLGAELCKRRARQSLYWVNMNADIDLKVKNCRACQEQARANPKQPLIHHERPSLPYTKVAADFFSWGNKNYIVIVDYYSGHITTEKLMNANSENLIRFCKRTFLSFGIPSTFVSDNGPAFASRQFNQFTESWGIQQKTSSPEYPQSNGLA